MNYTFHIDSDQLSAQIAERLDHDAIAEMVDLSELADNLPMSTLADLVGERIAVGEVAGAIDLGDLAESVYPLIINDEESLRSSIEALQYKTDEAERRLDSQVDRIFRLEQNQVGIAPDQLRRIEDLEARIRLLEASVTVFITLPEPEEDEVIDLEEFNQPATEMVSLSMPSYVYERIMDGIRKHSILTDLDAREMATYLQASRCDAYQQ